ncbi:MAG TPA: acetyl-CoA carboxylase biotin carboxyl carrier protein subunit [Ignavibacteria bacterium]|nr:acetyl-CoA carboxylase biotin carboxyl carrier protein subunit [Ignavibacteria bacterium]HQY51052.1 acetyl-CoA carboxylase biotin carboxyl carrier protein subunit [Ignavibacteria bacterium]HRA99398.1 acetyl-CoA carboxylase biotin carboxyl carrier protein subunit [Ignavibacteria bacterium]
MKKFQISFADPDSTGVSHSNQELTLLSDNTAIVNGKEIEFDSKWLNPNVLILRINNKNYYITAEENTDENFTEINIDSLTHRVTCKSEFDILKEQFAGNKSDDKSKSDILSPMPGIIKKMNVTEGQEVKKGDVILVLEAMKMENEIKAKKDSIIKKICVEEMCSVEKNELLIMLE